MVPEGLGSDHVLLESLCFALLDWQMKSSQTSISPSARCEANRRDAFCKSSLRGKIGRAHLCRLSRRSAEAGLRLLFLTYLQPIRVGPTGPFSDGQQMSTCT